MGKKVKVVKPWDNVDIDDDELEALWKTTKAEEFYFDVRINEGDETEISITPVQFFDQSGYMFDQHLDIEHLLPTSFGDDKVKGQVCFDQIMEGVFESTAGLDKTTKALLDKGFKQSKKFTKLIKEAND